MHLNSSTMHDSVIIHSPYHISEHCPNMGLLVWTDLLFWLIQVPHV